MARRGRDGQGALLRGITLSADQEKSLRANQSRHLQATKPLMLEMMSARTDEQLARLDGDQKALDAAKARRSASRARLDSLRGTRSSASELRAVLTPDQQTLFDRNRATAGVRRTDRRGAADPRNSRTRVAPRPRRGMERPSRPRPDSLDKSPTGSGMR
ncbi:MAG: Spy/CpxP family protein refolding chaperone [Gemmatimonadaceae bacterium]|nr:Spy/CpxP family protein refolding chaperone [Gemmatimonadaceae bacterium]